MPKRKRATTKAKAKPSRGKVKGGKPKSRGATPKRGSTKARAKRSGSAQTQAKRTAMKVLAGAAAGAVRAMVPPLEEAAQKMSPPKKG
jgi:hypothetical protein